MPDFREPEAEQGKQHRDPRKGTVDPVLFEGQAGISPPEFYKAAIVHKFKRTQFKGISTISKLISWYLKQYKREKRSSKQCTVTQAPQHRLTGL